MVVLVFRHIFALKFNYKIITIFMNRILKIALAALLLPVMAFGQTVKEEIFNDLNKAGGVYYAYPVTTVEQTETPKGYEPFYISHYGRHGSRYLIADNDYLWVLQLMRRAKEAGALTPLGLDALGRVEKVWLEAEGRGGDLSPLGVRQHRGIAERMFNTFPEVFEGQVDISARSTIVMRCAMSMDAFCERLKELNPELNITREASNRYMRYMNYHSPESNAFNAPDGPWQEEYRKFEVAHTHGDRLVGTLFSDSLWVVRNVDPHKLMWGFYWLAVGMQDIETQVSFFDLFEPQELFDLYQCFNYRFYVGDSNYPGSHGMLLDNAKPLLRNVVESADAAIASGKTGATLRFGHDGNLIPFAGLLGLENCYNSVENPAEFYKHFVSYEISPMAGNVQIIFFRNKKNHDDIIVKFMLNEREISIPRLATDMFPFYRWNDVRSYFMQIIAQ